MKIDFRPQRLINNLVMEEKLNAKQVRRVIDIPAKSGVSRKTLDITYTKSDLMPTQWFVSSYNLYANRKGLGLKKSLVVDQNSLNNRNTVVTDYGQNGFRTKLDIKKIGQKIFKSRKYLSSDN